MEDKLKEIRECVDLAFTDIAMMSVKGGDQERAVEAKAMLRRAYSLAAAEDGGEEKE